MRILAVSTVIILLFMAVPLSALETTPVQKSDIALEVFLMTQSMDELIQLLKSQRSKTKEAEELQKLGIAVEYLSFRSRRIEAKEKVLRVKKHQRDRMEKLVAKIEDDPEQWERFDRNAQSTPITTSSDARPSEYRLRLLKEQIDTLNSEIFTLEPELAIMVDELSECEVFVQEKLNLIQ